MRHAEGEAFVAEHGGFGNAGVVGDAGAQLVPGVRRVAVAPHGDDWRDGFEFVDHVDDVHVAGVEDEVDTLEGVGDLLGQVRASLGDVSVGYETEAHRRNRLRA